MAGQQSLESKMFRQVGETNTLRIVRSEKQGNTPTPLWLVFDSQSAHSSRVDSEPEPATPTYEAADNKHVEANTKISPAGQAAKADDMLPREEPDLS